MEDLNEVKDRIVRDIIFPSIEGDIRYTVQTRTIWSTVSTICITLSITLIGLSTLLSFLAEKLGPNFSIYAGAVNIIAIILERFSGYANLQDHIKTVEVNKILDQLGIKIKFNDFSKINEEILKGDNSDDEENKSNGHLLKKQINLSPPVKQTILVKQPSYQSINDN